MDKKLLELEILKEYGFVFINPFGEKEPELYEKNRNKEIIEMLGISDKDEQSNELR